MIDPLPGPDAEYLVPSPVEARVPGRSRSALGRVEKAGRVLCVWFLGRCMRGW